MTPDEDSTAAPEGEQAVPDAALLEADEADAPAPRERKRPRPAAVAAWTALALAVLLTALWALLAFAVVAPDPACGWCHGPQAASLAKGVHGGGADCYDCHSAPDFVSRTARIARDASAVFRLGREAEASVDDAACKRCHGRLEKVVEARGLRISHSTCMAGTSRCTDCHSDAGHGALKPGRGIDMDSCARCHDGEAATIRCEACHAGKRQASLESTTTWAVIHGPNWKSNHGMGDLTTCRICHDVTRDCSRCHLPVPHSSDWATLHGREVLAKGRAKCIGCHVPQLCEGCHGTVMPHPAGWLASHVTSTTPEQAKGMCRTCHVEADCRDCHEMHVHPGIPADVLKRMRGR